MKRRTTPTDPPAEGFPEGTPRYAVTPAYALPYPALPDPANVPYDVKALADRLDVVLAQIAAAGGGGVQQLQYATAPNYTAIAAATSPGAPQDVLSLPAYTFDGSEVWIEFYSPRVSSSGSFGLALWDGVVNHSELANVILGGDVPVYARRRLTPTAGSHTFKVRAYCNNAGPGAVYGGSATGPGAYWPCFLRVLKGA